MKGKNSKTVAFLFIANFDQILMFDWRTSIKNAI